MSLRPPSGRRVPAARDGFTLIECMVTVVVLSVGLLGVLGMFGTAYTDIARGGGVTLIDSTMLQTMEDIRNLPFANILALNGVTTSRAGSAPVADPERSVARKFKYWLNGKDPLWGFTANEIQTKFTAGGSPDTDPGAVGTITVADVTPGFPARTDALYQVTIAVTSSGINTAATLGTLVARCPSTIPGNSDVACP
jgi:prepilin-type N-terminal cleavage/methylation domain-containing protein